MNHMSNSAEPRLEETKRIARVLRIIQLVSSRPRGWTRAALAREFELSTRMIDNDLQLIRHGLRYDLRRATGGYYLADGPMMKPLHLSIPEALALALAAQGARQTGTADVATLSSALARLESGLPAPIVPYLRKADVVISGPVFGPMRERAGTLMALEQAQIEGRKVRITYTTASRGGAISERVVGPYALQFYERSWIMIGHDSLRDEVRIFKVDRIGDCKLTDDQYVIPADFDLEAYLEVGWGIVRGGAGPVQDVILHFTAESAAWVRDERWHVSQRMTTHPDGTLTVRFRCGTTHEMVRWLLSFGGQVEIEEPPELRRAVVDEALHVIRMAGVPDDVQYSSVRAPRKETEAHA